ncbi:hypothetical protein C8R32_1141, partial [Nitrosospira sp. Nsp5]
MVVKLGLRLITLTCGALLAASSWANFP